MRKYKYHKNSLFSFYDGLDIRYGKNTFIVYWKMDNNNSCVLYNIRELLEAINKVDQDFILLNLDFFERLSHLIKEQNSLAHAAITELICKHDFVLPTV